MKFSCVWTDFDLISIINNTMGWKPLQMSCVLAYMPPWPHPPPLIHRNNVHYRFQWPRGIKRGSAATRFLGFESRRGHGCQSLVSVVCCQVEVSASGRSHVLRSPTECGVSECDRGTLWRRPRPTRGCRAIRKKISVNITNHDAPHYATFSCPVS
jgi:hypothetical protein